MVRIIRMIGATVMLAAAGFAAGCGGAHDTVGGKLALVNCTVVDGTGASPLERATVLIDGDRITDIGTGLSVPADWKRLDLTGMTVLPGLINAHVHTGYVKANLEAWLAAGVTTVRDMAPFNGGDTPAVRDRLNRSSTQARLVAASRMITKPGGYGSLAVDSPTQAEAAVAKAIAGGVDLIKIAIEDDLQGRQFPLLTEAEVRAITAAAQAKSVRVSAHISHARHLPLAIAAGVDDIAHMVVEPVDEATLKRMVELGMDWTPTLELWHGVSQKHELDWDQQAIANLTRFYEAGGRVALGTDYGGYTTPFELGLPWTEITLMQQAGMANMDIIVAATRNAAHVCGMEDRLGTVESGKIADLLVVAGDPVSDLGVLREPVLVIHNGEVRVDNRARR